MNTLDFDERYLAISAREQRRFDGWFYTAVTSTWIYCRADLPGAAPRPQERAVLRPRRLSAEAAVVPAVPPVPA